MHVIERGAGTPIILIHGFGVDHRILLPLDSVFETAGGWRRLYLDLPATEGTPIGEVAGAEDIVSVVADEIRTQVGEEPFAILGSSFGGMIARRLAHDFRSQVLGLATMAAVFVAEHGKRQVPARTVLSEDPELLDRLGKDAAPYAEMAVVQSADNAQAFINHVFPGRQSVDEEGLGRIAQRYGLAEEPEEASPEPFTQPSLFIAGKQDHVVGYHDGWNRNEHYPRSTYAALDAAGHNVHIDQPGIAAALITEWLARIRADR